MVALTGYADAFELIHMSSWRVVATGLALVLCAILALPDPGYVRSGARTGSQSRGGSHLYVLLGLGNNSPGLSEFGSRMAHEMDLSNYVLGSRGARAVMRRSDAATSSLGLSNKGFVPTPLGPPVDGCHDPGQQGSSNHRVAFAREVDEV